MYRPEERGREGKEMAGRWGRAGARATGGRERAKRFRHLWVESMGRRGTLGRRKTLRRPPVSLPSLHPPLRTW